jgi:hypothetical protein
MTVIRIMLQDIRRNLPFLARCALLVCAPIGGAVLFALLGLDPGLGVGVALLILAICHPIYLWVASARRRARERDREWTA